MLDVKSFLSHVTTRPGVYQMFGSHGTVLYIGKARNLKKRLASYFSNKQKDQKALILLSHLKDIQVIVTNNENEALLLEANLIKKLKPHYNVLFRDDKSYPFILIAAERPYPYIDFYRGNQKIKGTYFGPYPNAHAVRETIYLIQKLFGLRIAADRYLPNRTRPCLQYQLGLCSGSCAGLISPEDYQRDVQHAILFLQGKNDQALEAMNAQMEHAALGLQFETAAKLRDQMAKLREVRARQYISTKQGEVDVIALAVSGNYCIQLLMVRGGRVLGSRNYFPNVPEGASGAEVLSSFMTQHYFNSKKGGAVLPKEIILSADLPDRTWLQDALSEFAEHRIIISTNVRGERKKWLEIAHRSATQSLISFDLKKTALEERFLALDHLLQLSHPIKRVECFDVSHTHGEGTVASCVVFNREGPIKNDYRRFNIKEITPGDDIAAMQQAVRRRFLRLQREEAKCPDVLLIDGGPSQIKATNKVLDELSIGPIIVLGVAKGVARKPGLEKIHLKGLKPFQLSPTSLASHLIQQIRDEAHRFAITGHRQRRDKKRTTSKLESIPGIGMKRRRELLRYFGGLQAINRASLEELAKVPGISQALAERIFAALHDVMPL